MSTSPKDASPQTQAKNRSVELPFDPADFDRAARGLVATHETGVIESKLGVVWDINRYAFIDGDNPDTVTASLWRQAKLNNIHGLFEVAPGLWQARGYDLSNISFIEGETGWIIIDPLTSPSTARACLDLANHHLGERPVAVVIYTHSHVDHFGGVEGVISQADVDEGRCQVVAPEHFMEEAVSENVIAGFAMARRAAYQFGPLLPPGPKSHVDCGLGKAVPIDSPSLIAPTLNITETGQELVLDGVRVVFQLTPEAEAPAEMNFFFPDKGWLCMAENCTSTMHNLVPIRGAKVRDSLAWSKYIGEAIELFGDDSILVFASHHWPRWGKADLLEYLAKQRDLYRWMHDQTMRLANHGYVATEIADMMVTPDTLARDAHLEAYYGHLSHNVKAVYQRYLSWYDGNPAHLDLLSPAAVGERYVKLAGGPDALIAKARQSFEEGDYRWVAELVNHLVFADPANTEARELQADTLEQLGYQSTAAPFRNAYLTGAQELRAGLPIRRKALRRGLLKALSLEQLLDGSAVRLNPEGLGSMAAEINLTLSGSGEERLLALSNSTLRSSGSLSASPDLAITLGRSDLESLLLKETSLDDLVASGAATVEGDGGVLATIIDHLDDFESGFGIVEP